MLSAANLSGNTPTGDFTGPFFCKRSANLHSYHFSLGNSRTGAIGLCARVRASSPESAIKKLKARLPETFSVQKDGERPGEYIEIYFNADAITVDAVDMVNIE